MRFLLPFFILFASCSSNSDVQETRFIMGTLVEFTIAGSDSSMADQALIEATSEMQRIEDAFTIYGTTDNAVKAFNATPPDTAVELPVEVADLLAIALDVEDKSNHAFDPSLGKLNLLWGFSGETSPLHPPLAAAISEAKPPLQCIRRIDNKWLRTDTRCMLDFGAIAKGYAIDRGITVLKKHGIHNAIINAGGDIRIIGSHNGKPWRIGLRHPRNKAEVLGTLTLVGSISIVTSGDYERYFMADGKRYHHILDPQSGLPATASQSATVIAPEATLADAWSTALFVQGASGLAEMNQLGYAALTVDRHGQTHLNEGMQAIFNPAR